MAQQPETIKFELTSEHVEFLRNMLDAVIDQVDQVKSDSEKEVAEYVLRKAKELHLIFSKP